jgi:integrase
MAKPTRKRREEFGRLRQRDSGRWQASFALDGQIHNAPQTFDTKVDARGWLTRQQHAIEAGTWQPFEMGQTSAARKARTKTFGEYAADWISTRVNSRGEPLRPRTRVEYERLVAGPLKPFSRTVLAAFTPPMIRKWRQEQNASGSVTQTARAYSLLKSILSTAISDRVWGITTNPCIERGAANANTGKKVVPPTPAQLQKIVDTITPRYRAAILIAAWAGCRYGELTELRRKDITLVKDGRELQAIIVNVSRAVTHTTGVGFTIGKTKSEAGVRAIALPPHIYPEILAHLKDNVGDFPDSLLYPARDGVTHLAESSFVKHWYPARKAAKRSDMPFHALRHYGATRFAQTGATLKEIQERLGHSTVAAAMRYQHSAGRDVELAKRMSALAQM